eukprot:EG_transcript_13439
MATQVHLPHEYRSYGRRWFMLFLYFGVAAQNSNQWICLSPVVNVVAEHFGTSPFWVYCSILVFDLFSIFSFAVGSFIARNGCGQAIFYAAMLTCFGGWIKASWLTATGQVVGQTIIALAHVFSAVSVPVFSAVWFPTSQRALSTSILFFSTILGGGGGFLLAPLIIRRQEDVPLFMLVQAIIGTITCAPAVFLQRKPPSPPSRSAEIAERQHPTSFSKDVRTMLRHHQFLILLAAFCLSFGLLNTVAITANDIFKDFGYNNWQIGVIGSGTVFCGMLGCVFLSVFVDWTDLYKESLVVMNLLAALAMCLLWVNLKPNNLGWLAFSIFMCGFFGISSFPVAYEVGCEILFPIHEAVSTGVMTVCSQWLSILMVVVEYFGMRHKDVVPLGAALMYTVVVALYLCFRGDLKRRMIDRQAGVDE